MKYQTPLKDNKVQCTVCPRNCKLNEGQNGFCYVRKNEDGNVVLTSYGYNTGLAIDPIEKKPLYHFYPGTNVLSFGTLGCNMGCNFCQNWHISKTKGDIRKLQYASPEQIAETALAYDCKSVAFTYNDPVIFFEYAVDTAKVCREKGIKTVAVTAGYINPEPRKEFFKYMDAANIDLKSFSEDFYRRNCLAHIKPVLDTIKYVANETDCHLELTTLLIEGENASEKEIRAECEWVLENVGDEIPLHFSAFHPSFRLTNVPPTSVGTVLKAYSIARDMGIKYVYTGNIVDNETSTTFCPECKKAVIVRNNYIVPEYHLTGSLCDYCGYKIAGKFNRVSY